MSKKMRGDGLVWAVMGFGAVGLVYHWYAQKQQEAEDAAEWKRYAKERGLEDGTPGYLECHEAWHSARDYSRKIDGKQLAELDRLERVVDQAEALVAVSQGLHKSVLCVMDPTVPDLVRASILAHWMARWNELFQAWPPDVFGERAIYEKLMAELTRLREDNGGEAPLVSFGFGSWIPRAPEEGDQP